MQTFFNPLMRFLLRSPLHGLASGSTILITYTGRKSGRTYETPVNYVEDGGTLWVTSTKARTWWRNLRGGDPVTVRLRGEDARMTPEVFEQNEGVARGLSTYLGGHPGWAGYFGVKIGADGTPKPEDIAEAAESRVIIRLERDVRA